MKGKNVEIRESKNKKNENQENVSKKNESQENENKNNKKQESENKNNKNQLNKNQLSKEKANKNNDKELNNAQKQSGENRKNNGQKIDKDYKKKTVYKNIAILFSVIILLSLIVFALFSTSLFKVKYEDFVKKYSKEYNLNEALVYAIIKTESDFDKNAVSSAGAMGLMQITKSTGKWIASEFGENYDESVLFDAETNIKYGCYYLSYLFKKFSDTDTVICAYNAGETTVRAWLDGSKQITTEKIAYKETKNYLLKVKKFYSLFTKFKAK